MNKPLKWIAGLAAAIFGALALSALVAWLALRAQPGEWTLRIGPARLGFDASAPTLLRWATHPLAAPQLDGRKFTTRTGRWTLQARADGAIEARCAPCALPIAQLGAQPITVVQAIVVLNRRGADRFDGTLRLGADDGAVMLPWRAQLKAEALRVHAELAPTPIAQLLALFDDALPEAQRAQVDGHFALVLDAVVDGAGLRIERITPRLDGVTVAGLGTEALADADALSRCRPQPAAGRVEGWLPHAVLAAEDQRFFEHPGYELEQWLAAWQHNAAAPDALQGASTITMQLAKILYTGDERSAARKLREWLYAVEMERTLGKGRILQLYLATVPWGDGTCGAEAAARHHLGKPTTQLKPREAAFLASLLVNPDAQVRRWAGDEAAARERAAVVLRGMRRLPRERREAELDALADWRPPVGRSLLARPATP